MPQAVGAFSACSQGEVVQRAFDFTSGLQSLAAAGRADGLIGSSVTCSIIVAPGSAVQDSAPQSRLLSGPSTSRNIVTVFVGNLLVGATYKITVTARTMAGQTLSCWALQTCNN
jgi:hypothetical protein